MSENNRMLKKVSETDWNNKKYIRAGIIPYIEEKGIRFYAFGLENCFATIGDFGGHKEKRDHDALDTALREYVEESLNVFGILTRDKVKDCVVIDGKDTAEILVPVEGPMFQYSNKFKQLIGSNPLHEVQNIVWLSRKQLLLAIDSQGEKYEGTKPYLMYGRIRDTIDMNRYYI